METEEELELDDPTEEDEEALQPEPEVTEEGTEPNANDKKFADIQAKLEAVVAGTNTSSELRELIQLGKGFLEKQSRPAETAPAGPDPEKLEQFGKMLQEAILTKEPKDAAQFLLESFSSIAKTTVDNEITRRGAPLADKTGNFMVQMFLQQKRDEVGPAKEGLHKAIAKGFALNANERQWIAQNDADSVTQFLENKYRQHAGELLLSSKKVRPRDISTGGGGGGARGPGSVTAIPGMSARDQRQLDELAERLYPDPKVRAEKMKRVAARAEGA